MQLDSSTFMSQLRSIATQFRLDGDVIDIRPMGAGHIHESFRVDAGKWYVLQRINHSVFQDVGLLMQNLETILNHQQNHHPPVQLQLIRTLEDEAVYQDNDGNDWRLFDYIDHVPFDENNLTPTHVFEAGKAFGSFLYQMSDLSPYSIGSTISRFHDFFYRYEQFEKAVQNNPLKRKDSVADLIDRSRDLFTSLSWIGELKEHPLPVRITHNDTKLNNILFDSAGHAVSVVDLDTVMPGHVISDFGDAIRFISGTREDEPNLALVQLDLNLFQQFARGYLLATASILTQEETDALVWAPQFMTFMIGLRFLTDYLNGDVYFKIHDADENQRRARVQFRILEEMVEKQEKIVTAIRRILHDLHD